MSSADREAAEAILRDKPHVMRFAMAAFTSLEATLEADGMGAATPDYRQAIVDTVFFAHSVEVLDDTAVQSFVLKLDGVKAAGREIVAPLGVPEADTGAWEKAHAPLITLAGIVAEVVVANFVKAKGHLPPLEYCDAPAEAILWAYGVNVIPPNLVVKFLNRVRREAIDSARRAELDRLRSADAQPTIQEENHDV